MTDYSKTIFDVGQVNNPEPKVSIGQSSPPSHHEYQGGFATRLAHKDMILAVAAARELRTPVPLGAFAETLFRPLVQPGSGYDTLDFSAIYKYLEERKFCLPGIL